MSPRRVVYLVTAAVIAALIIFSVGMAVGAGLPMEIVAGLLVLALLATALLILRVEAWQ